MPSKNLMNFGSRGDCLLMLVTPCQAMVMVLLVFFGNSYSQKLDAIGKEKPLALSGGVSLNQVAYAVKGIESRRSPYAYYASGNVNIALYGWNVPVSFSFSNQQTTFQQPFNRYSLHPAYKFITAHLGYTSMTFSPYTVSGHVFLGAGVDLAPEGKWKFSALYGRFNNGVEHVAHSPGSALPAFRRMGGGFKASYADGGNTADLILFHARDQINSIGPLPDSVNIFPQENLVLSVSAGKTLLDHVVLKGEFASSAITHDMRAEKVSHAHSLHLPDFLYQARTSSAYYHAYKASVSYQQNAYSLGVALEHIDPQYRTMGAYYFNNDLENVTVNGTGILFHNKMNVTANAGLQRDNLDKTKMSTLRRVVGSVNVSYRATDQLNFTGSYSSFQSYANVRSPFVNINQLTPYDNLDTLNYMQITRSITASGLYSFGKSKQRKNSINMNGSCQRVADKQGAVGNTASQFYNLNAAYVLSVQPANVTVSVALNATIHHRTNVGTRTLGPTASVSKSFFDKKFKTTFSSSMNGTYDNGSLVNRVVNGRLSGALSLKKKHSLNLAAVVVHRRGDHNAISKSFTEFTGTMGYAYSFAVK